MSQDPFDQPRLAINRVYTRQAPEGYPTGRLTKESLAAVIPDPATLERTYVCGPTPFVEAVSDWLIELGHQPGTIRTERFGGA